MGVSLARSFSQGDVVRNVQYCQDLIDLTPRPASHYPRTIDVLGERFNQRNLPDLVRWFLYLQDNPDNDRDVEDIPLAECPYLFNVTDVLVFHSAQATFFAPSNPSGVLNSETSEAYGSTQTGVTFTADTK